MMEVQAGRDMEVRTWREETVVIAQAHGRIEGPEGAEALRRTMDEALVPGDTTMILDLENLSYMSSAGLRAIAMIVNRTKRMNARLVVCVPDGGVRELFGISGFDQIVDVEESVHAAMRKATK